MAEVLFYHLTASPLERNLPAMLEKSLERGWRVLVRCGAPEAVAFLDRVLWTYNDSSFLPHGTAETGHAGLQPVYLTTGDDNPNGANVLMLVEGARAAPDEMSAFDRTCLIFDGTDAGAVETARADWRAVTGAGLTAVYWAQEAGRWVKKATS